MTRGTLNRPPRARSPREVARHARELADAFAQARRTASATGETSASDAAEADVGSAKDAAEGKTKPPGRSKGKRSS